MQNRNYIKGRKQICDDETIVIPQRCRERFLGVGSPHLLPLREAGIQFSGHSILSKGYHIKRIDPKWHSLIYTLDGKGKLATDGKSYTLHPGSLYISPAHVPHEYSISHPSWNMVWFCLKEGNGFHCEPDKPYIVESSFSDLISSIVQQLTYDPDYTARLKPEILDHCVQLLLRIIRHDTKSARVSSAHRQQHKIDSIFLAVHRNPAANWNVPMLIEQGHLALGEDRFRQLCVKFYNQTPIERVRHIRLQIAQELLEATDYPLRTIAPMIGYRNEFAFSSAFKRVHKISPSEYRRRRNT